MSKYQLIGYNITGDPDFLDKLNAITPELKRKINDYHTLAVKGKKSSVPVLLDAIKKYPQNPNLKNYLSLLYMNLGDKQKAFETNHWVVSEHPDYLFGKINLANEYYLAEKYDMMPEVLGEAMELKLLYPHRDTFHLLEVLAFLKTSVLYFIGIDELEQAENRLEIMQEIGDGFPDTDFAEQVLFDAKAAHSTNQFKEKEALLTKVEITQKQKRGRKKRMPKFQNQEVEILYLVNIYVYREVLNNIMSAPRESLIEDLELVLQDSIDRFGYFRDRVDEEGYKEENLSFVVHAIFMLGELKATNSVESILKVFSQSQEYINYLIDEYFFALLWEPLYKLAEGNIDTFKAFMKKPGIDIYAKACVADAMVQLAGHKPEYRDEVEKWFTDILQFYLNSSLKDNVIDSTLNSLLVTNVLELEIRTLRLVVEQFYDKGLIDTFLSHDWEHIENEFMFGQARDYKQEILSMPDRYKQITDSWDEVEKEYNETLDSVFEDDFQQLFPDLPAWSANKTGRNEPCPCGSGKKYKKCCLNKLS